MIVTSVALTDIVHDDSSSPKAALLLASHVINNTAKLIWCNWLALNEHWQDKIKLKSLSKHYKFDADEAIFIAAKQLDANDKEQAVLLASIAQMQHYMQGLRSDFDLPIDTSSGTEFQQRVWDALQEIGYGETISYATLAQRVDNPKGFRAVANANGKNPFSVIIPCHRVISSDGKLGGYTGGLDKKAYLLALEGVSCKV
ncbi:methylated-DNA--[protein]-cysteine S-methyltransferase [Psychrobacter alimentarius]|uniref:methylated-DNA--[protein]-cysteine S-methyltransferase n=1 Tax=Psychrobacter alimentarius TaxID=261164 RepID=UPI001918E8D3|nr:methylated-DNA--[protein]-cysteine S-methyltransferase [Psychrobacter alimentarius]